MEVPSAQSEDQDNYSGQSAEEASTHNLSSKVEVKVKAKDKLKPFYFKLVPFVSS